MKKTKIKTEYQIYIISEEDPDQEHDMYYTKMYTGSISIKKRRCLIILPHFTFVCLRIRVPVPDRSIPRRSRNPQCS